MNLPDMEIANRVVKKLKEKIELSDVGINKIQKGLGEGGLSVEDWILIFDADRPEKRK